MIIPTPEFDPFFSEGGTPFRERMLEYIHREFADLLQDRHPILKFETKVEVLRRVSAILGDEEKKAA